MVYGFKSYHDKLFYTTHLFELHKGVRNHRGANIGVTDELSSAVPGVSGEICSYDNLSGDLCEKPHEVD